MKEMNGRFTSSPQLFSEAGTRTLGRSLQQFNTHYHFGKFDFFSGRSKILENAAYLSCGCNGYLSGNTKSLFIEKIFSVFDFQLIPLLTKFHDCLYILVDAYVNY